MSSFLAISTARAADNDGSVIAANGTEAGAPACASCHGEHGEGQPAGPFPRLAGIDAGYLTTQLQEFASGRRANAIMGPVATALTPEQMKAVAAYYAHQSPPKADEPDPLDPALVTAGRQLAERGDWSKSLPACSQCHGPMGEGVGDPFPKLSGQSMEYIAAQLQAWQSKERSNDPLGLMAHVASKLSDKDVKAVASYYASLPAGPGEGGADAGDPSTGLQDGAAAAGNDTRAKGETQ